MFKLFLVTRSRGPRWDFSRPMEEQEKWTEHAELMDRLTAEKFIILGGPIDGTREALLILRARDAEEIKKRLLDPDPWTQNGLLMPPEIKSWTVRLGSV